MNSFIELTQVDKRPIIINRYHISTITKGYHTDHTLIRIHNGSMFEVTESYKDVSDIVGGKMDACK